MNENIFTDTIDEKELELINSFTRRKMTDEELYAFSIVLCDNEIDRDMECFSAAALEELAPMFIGKTGVSDHNPTADNQQARIFSTSIEADPARRTADGEPYTRLTARAYMPRSEKTEQLILEIDSGIRKEVSVGCAMNSRVCSICGRNRADGCGHIRGREYNFNGRKSLCHDILSGAADAYEWSFVAVPSQRQAGVIKHMGDGSLSRQIEKSFSSGGSLTLESGAVYDLSLRLKELEENAAYGEKCREELRKSVKRYSTLCGVNLGNAAEKMTVSELEELNRSLLRQAEKHYPLKPQLAAPAEIKAEDNGEYMI